MSKKKSSNSLSNQMKALQGQISAAGVASADETGLSTSLGNITGASALGQANAQDPTKNPVALGFQTGQAAAIDTQANAASVPLSTRLALLQQNRQTQLDAYKTNYGMLSDQKAAQDAKSAAKQAQKNALKIEKARAGASIDVAGIKAAPKPKAVSKPKPKATTTKPKRSL